MMKLRFARVVAFAVPALMTLTAIDASALNFKFDDSSTIALPVMVGDTSESFTFDTGASTTILAATPAHALFPAVSTISTSGAGGSTTQCTVVQVPRLAFDHISLDQLQLAACPGATNLLGLDILDQRIFNLDTRDAKIWFLTRDPVYLPSPVYRTKGGHISVMTSFGSLQGAGVFDTGCSMTTVDSYFVKKHPELFKPTGKTAMVVDATGNNVPAEYFMIDEFKIGSIEFGKSMIMSMDLEPLRKAMGEPTVGLIIGENMIRQAYWTIDLQSNRWGAMLRSPAQ